MTEMWGPETCSGAGGYFCDKWFGGGVGSVTLQTALLDAGTTVACTVIIALTSIVLTAIWRRK
jgi:hypothetical protein